MDSKPSLKTYRLPPKFYFDHIYRDLPEEGISSVVSRSKTQVFVEMDAAAYDDLRGDADYYSDSDIAKEMGMPGLAASARSTVKALDKQGRPEGGTNA